MDKRIGAQLFTVYNHIQTIEDFDESCKRIMEIGYKTVQVSGTGLPAEAIKPILEKYDLRVTVTHKSFDDFKNNLDGVIEYNKVLGSDICGLGMMPVNTIESKAKFKGFIGDINRICDEIKKEGLHFGYHNHSFEFGKFGGKTVFDILTEETDPETFKFIVDTYWVQVGGKNPAEVIRNLGSRVAAVHFKDSAINFEKWQTPVMSEVGSGNLNWDDIIAASEVAGVCWALVEQDNNWINNDPFESLQQSYSFLKTKGFI